MGSRPTPPLFSRTMPGHGQNGDDDDDVAPDAPKPSPHPRLPPELRLMVWRLALWEPSVVAVRRWEVRDHDGEDAGDLDGPEAFVLERVSPAPFLDRERGTRYEHPWNVIASCHEARAEWESLSRPIDASDLARRAGRTEYGYGCGRRHSDRRSSRLPRRSRGGGGSVLRVVDSRTVFFIGEYHRRSACGPLEHGEILGDPRGELMVSQDLLAFWSLWATPQQQQPQQPPLHVAFPVCRAGVGSGPFTTEHHLRRIIRKAGEPALDAALRTATAVARPPAPADEQAAGGRRRRREPCGEGRHHAVQYRYSDERGERRREWAWRQVGLEEASRRRLGRVLGRPWEGDHQDFLRELARRALLGGDGDGGSGGGGSVGRTMVLWEDPGRGDGGYSSGSGRGGQGGGRILGNGPYS